MYLKGEPADYLSGSALWEHSLALPSLAPKCSREFWICYQLSFHTWIFKCLILMVSLTCSVFHCCSFSQWSVGAWQMQGSCGFCHASDCTNALPWYRGCITVPRMQYLTSAACGCQPFSKLLHFASLAFTLLGQKLLCTIIVVYFNSPTILENVNYSSISYCRYMFWMHVKHCAVDTFSKYILVLAFSNCDIESCFRAVSLPPLLTCLLIYLNVLTCNVYQDHISELTRSNFL